MLFRRIDNPKENIGQPLGIKMGARLVVRQSTVKTASRGLGFSRLVKERQKPLLNFYFNTGSNITWQLFKLSSDIVFYYFS